ncbi:PTS system, mannose-specific IIA component [Enterococcus sp. AZ194]|uniref:PTS sugar transporter subunit IIA n=1 Tax=Enterococcus sp. AZ194 TaxID=2774629 RepID=UPI003F243B18
MGNEAAILLMSHGDFAKEAKNSAELIIGPQDNVETLGVHLADNVEALVEELKQKVAKLDVSKGLVVVTDIVGGTPMNLAGNLMAIDNLLISSGLNLPLLLELFLNRQQEIEKIKELIQVAYQSGQTIRTQDDFREEDEEDDQIL